MAVPDPHFTEFVRSGSEEAFARLAAKHMGAVYSTARRVLGHREDAAADVAQVVFCQLARQAKQLPPDVVVSLWLHTVTRRAALNVIRGETRRMARERTAADLMELNAFDPAGVNTALMPHIDSAIAELPKVDQRALALRFFEQCPFQEIGARLGLSPEAARKRLTRALETLRIRLSRRGVTLSAAALTLWLSEEAVKAAPPSLTASALTAEALQSSAHGAVAGAGTGGVFSLSLAMTGIKSIVIGAILGLAGGSLWATRPSTGNVPTADPFPAPSGGSPFKAPGNGAATAPRFAVPAPADTEEGLLNQLNSIISAPDTGLTRQRLAVWLEGVRPDLWDPLIRLADLRFTKTELMRWLPELARQWAKVAPAAAIPSLAQRKGYGPMNGGGLAALGFQVWHSASSGKALSWLLEHQDDQGLAQALPGMVSVVAESLASSSRDAVLRWASQLQGNDLQEAALRPLWQKLGKDQRAWAEVCGNLLQEPDQPFRRLALTQALQRWSSYDVSGESQLDAADQWLTSLPPTADRKTAAELIVSSAIASSQEKAPAAAMAVLWEAGPQAASATAARLIMESEFPGVSARGWLLPLVTGPEREDVMLHAARRWGSAREYHADGDGGKAIEWAAGLRDPDTRNSLIHSLSQQWLESQRKKLGTVKNVEEWLNTTELSADIQQVVRNAKMDFESGKKP